VSDSHEFSIPFRTLIVGCSLQFGLNYGEIAQKLGMSVRSAHKVYGYILEHLNPEKRKNTPRKIEPKSKESLQIREDVRRYEGF
jgi:transposase